MIEASRAKEPTASTNQTETNEQSAGRIISDPNEVAQLVIMRIDHVNAKKDELTIAVKALADTTKRLVNMYAKQQGQINMLAKKVEEFEKAKS